MPYATHFQHADDVVAHLNGVVPTLGNPLLTAKYVGFVSVAAVTVYEMAIKDIFCDFANRKHSVLGAFVESHFKRINGRIKLQIVKDEYIPRFGTRYTKKFSRLLESTAKSHLRLHRRDIKTSYNNLIVWRNDFAHEGKINSTTTYNEVVQAYLDGKEVIHCLAQAMVR
ncbi:HEPN domain-containing protein [Verrucomicrobium sp. BvORR106]|uniref:HEPN domain-containing protein n=1 Tax=Verrucomicrobium sp. BvORR106 TaxID=1403819 RepID=UPI00056DE5E4|nr:HEPN domain-containing protein [Verrucomicrobium sp. BvORR106]